MNRRPESERRDGELLPQTAPLDVRSPVDETQSMRQGATAPQPKIDLDDEADDLSPADLDEAWGELTSALIAADRDFDAAVAYARLSRALPPQLVAMPLVEPAPRSNAVDSRFEYRNLVAGLIAMGALCAGLAGLAIFGPGFERRSASERDAIGRVETAPPSNAPSSGAGEVWADVRWEEDLIALANELHAESYRIHDLRRGSFERSDEELRRLERDFAHARESFGRSFGF